MFTFVNVAYASTSSSSVEIFNQVVSTGGSVIEESYPLLYILGGLLLAAIALIMVKQAFLLLARKISGRR